MRTSTPTITHADVPVVSFKGDLTSLNKKIIEGRILDAAISQIANRPGFNPAAISIVFGLKW